MDIGNFDYDKLQEQLVNAEKTINTAGKIYKGLRPLGIWLRGFFNQSPSPASDSSPSAVPSGQNSVHSPIDQIPQMPPPEHTIEYHAIAGIGLIEKGVKERNRAIIRHGHGIVKDGYSYFAPRNDPGFGILVYGNLLGFARSGEKIRPRQVQRMLNKINDNWAGSPRTEIREIKTYLLNEF